MKAFISHANSNLLLVKMSFKFTQRSGMVVFASMTYAFPLINMLFRGIST